MFLEANEMMICLTLTNKAGDDGLAYSIRGPIRHELEAWQTATDGFETDAIQACIKTNLVTLETTDVTERVAYAIAKSYDNWDETWVEETPHFLTYNFHAPRNLHRGDPFSSNLPVNAKSVAQAA